ncbi:hypothetical protein DJ72_08555, partial [Halorubrum distributum]
MSIDNPNEAATASIEVLHVDDDPAFLDLTRSFIQRELGDVEITTVASPDAVLDTLDERSVHCVVSDYEMPGTDGLELLDAVR